MSEIAANSSRALSLLTCLFCVFLSLLPYLLFLYASKYYKAINVPFSIGKIVHDFYIFLTCSSVIITLICAAFFPLYFNSVGVVCILLAGVCISLCYLRWTYPFQSAVISQQLPLVPLVVTLVVTITGMGYTAFAMLVEATLLVESSQVHLIVQGCRDYKHRNSPA